MQHVSNHQVSLLSGCQWNKPKQSQWQEKHCLFPSLRSMTSWSTCSSQWINFIRYSSDKLTTNKSYWRIPTIPSSTDSQQTLVVSSLLAPLLQSQDGEALGCPKSILYLPTCNCPFCDFLQSNSIEDQQWAKYYISSEDRLLATLWFLSADNLL